MKKSPILLGRVVSFVADAVALFLHFHFLLQSIVEISENYFDL